MTTHHRRDLPKVDFRGRILTYRGRSSLSQRELAELVGVSERAVGAWEAGTSYPSAERLKALIALYVRRGVFAKGQVEEEARALWEVAREEAPRLQAAFDDAWFAQVLAGSPTTSRPSASSAEPGQTSRATVLPSVPRAEDWGEAPDVGEFHGRASELVSLTDWVLDDGCRLVAILGMGGMGKTTLAACLARELAPHFEHVYWRSLRNAPPCSEWLSGAILFLSDQQVLPAEEEGARQRQLMDLLRVKRCLLVLDNLETVLEPGAAEVRYRQGYEGYGQVLESLGGAGHQSCLLLTSREASPEMASSEGAHRPVRALRLGGVDVAAGRALLADKELAGDDAAWTSLVSRYGGNPLALLVVGETIRDLFGGEIAAFLAETEAVFGDIRRLLDAQVARLSPPERSALTWLAIEREPIDFGDLVADLGQGVTRGEAMEAVEGLGRRSLLEVAGRGRFTLQPVVLEYATDRLVRAVAAEIEAGHPHLLRTHVLVRAQAKDYVRRSQERLIGAPIIEQLRVRLGQAEAEVPMLALLERWRGRPAAEQEYGPGNVVNLLRLLRGDLRGLDLSRLSLRQAYLAETEVQDASLAGARLEAAVLAEAFTFPTSVALSADGAFLAAGTSTGGVRLWRVADRTPLLAAPGHSGTVESIALSLDGRLLASGGVDGTVKLWETSSGRLLATLQGHSGGVNGVALSPDGGMLASGGQDGTVRLWETPTCRLITVLEGHTNEVRGVALSGDGRLLASGSLDGTVRLWEVPGGRPLATLEGHDGGILSVALSADGGLLASGGFDMTVRLLEVVSGRPLVTLEGHVSAVWRVALSEDGRLVASGGQDGTLKVWDVTSGRLLATLQGHLGMVNGVALSGDGGLLASGGHDGTVKVWEPASGRPLATLQGHNGGINGVALSADGGLLASGSYDGTVRLWESAGGHPLATLEGRGSGWGVALSGDGSLVAGGTYDGMVKVWEVTAGRPLAVLRGQRGTVWCVAMSADGRLVAAGVDETVWLWEVGSGRSLATLEGHGGPILGVALSGDGSLVAGGAFDGTVKLWDASSGQLLATLRAYSGPVRCVALSGDGRLVASGGVDGIVRLWEVPSGRPVATLEGHGGGVYEVALSGDGGLVVGGCGDGTAKLWAVPSGQLRAPLQGHSGPVRGVALSEDGQAVATGGQDGTIRLWEASSGACLRVLRPERRYERLDITGLTGVMEAQRAALLALGAVERGT